MVKKVQKGPKKFQNSPKFTIFLFIISFHYKFQARPAPPHLTSIQAEQLLAKACENESENAKRMRMGLEPISQPMPASITHSIVDVLSSGGGPGSGNGQTTTLVNFGYFCRLDFDEIEFQPQILMKLIF